MTQIPKDCFVEKGHRGTKLVCEERTRRVVFRKPKGFLADKIRIDGCVVKNEPACDYLVRDCRNRHHFVELKGKHDEEALKQIEATIALFFPRGSKETLWGLVVGSGSSPATLPGLQSRKARIKKAWPKAEIVIRTNLYEHVLQ